MKVKIVSLKKAVDIYKVSHSHLRLMCRRGLLPAEKIGRDWFLTGTAAEIREALDAAPKKGKYERKKKPD